MRISQGISSYDDYSDGDDWTDGDDDDDNETCHCGGWCGCNDDCECHHCGNDYRFDIGNGCATCDTLMRQYRNKFESGDDDE